MLETTDLTPRIGVEVRLDKETLLSGSQAGALRELLVERGVLVIRDAGLSDDEQRAFAQSMGQVRLGHAHEKGENGLLKITYFIGTFFWHMDGTYEEVPPFATVLTPRVLSPTGGQTEFANTYAAFEDLPKDEQDHLSTLQVLHTMQASMMPAVPQPTWEQVKSWIDFPARTHPLVWRHASGRRSLVLSSSSSHVVGMHPAEARELLNRLIAHATQPSYVYRHEWRMGDLLMWDNTGTMHRVRPYDEDCGRRLHRFSLAGEEPITAVA